MTIERKYIYSNQRAFQDGDVITYTRRVEIKALGQNNAPYNYEYDGPGKLRILPRHKTLDGNAYSKIAVDGNIIHENGQPAGYKLHTIEVTVID